MKVTDTATTRRVDLGEFRRSRIGSFARWLEHERGLVLPDYDSLYKWSITDLPGFWDAVRRYLEVPFHTATGQVLEARKMPGASWYPGVGTNYASGLVSAGAGDEPALVSVSENGSRSTLSRAEFRRQVASLAEALRELGVGLGDRVVGYLTNIPEAAVAFYAAASIGAVWAAVGQDHEPAAAAARLAQLEPKVLISADGYTFRGVRRDRRDAVATLRKLIAPQATIVVDNLGLQSRDALRWNDLTAGSVELDPVTVPFEHPLWVLFSSGTTGVPKGIVHGHGGVQLEMYKLLALHLDLAPGRRLLWATSPSWVVWNILIAAPLVGATSVLYDGSPTFPDPDALWRQVAVGGITDFGTSPGFLAATRAAGSRPGRRFDLSALRHVCSTGSPLPASSAEWACDAIGRHTLLTSISGGTEVVGPFVGGAPSVPNVPGEIPARCLGVALQAWDADGRPVTDTVGELVVTEPMPSMPISFWNDPDGHRYKNAYFAKYPGVWCHGDWITVTGRGSVVIHGRSDATLNRNGIRMGSADIYNALAPIPEISDALVVGLEQPDGSYWMPLFVSLNPGVTLDDSVGTTIREAIRSSASPRHVPDEIIVVPKIPRNRTGKRLEVPVKRILMGTDSADAVSLAEVAEPDAMQFFLDLARRRAQATPQPSEKT